MRLPVGQIQALLRVLYGCQISTGEMVVEVLHRVVKHAKPVLEAIKG